MRFDPALISDERIKMLRHAWGVAQGARIVLLPARLTRWKGQQVLIEAASQLLASGDAKDLCFVLVGDDQGRSPYRIELEEMITALGLKGKVVLAGHCDDMPAAYKAAALTVIPSIEAEAFGRVSIEAQAVGCPVIVANIGALPETIAPEMNLLARVQSTANDSYEAAPSFTDRQPWLFEPGNPQALRDGLRFALSLSEETLEPLRRQAMLRVRTHFSKNALQSQTLAVYDRLLGTQLCSSFQNALRG